MDWVLDAIGVASVGLNLWNLDGISRLYYNTDLDG